MPNQLSKGHTYAPGDVVDFADLNALVDEAEVLKGTISEQSAVTAAPTDYVLITDTSDSGNLKRALVSSLPAGTVSSVDFGATPATIFDDTVTPPSHDGDVVISLSLANQSANKVLAGPVSGSAAEPGFRLLTPADMPTAIVTAIAALDIDWSLGNVFTKTLPTGAANSAFTFSNLSDGQTIKVRLLQNAAGNRTVSWPSVVWRDGDTPVMTALPNARDIFTFTRIDTLTYGYADQDFRL